MTKAYQNFIPQIWSARLIANLDKNFVYPLCVNRDYEGEIRGLGDTVKINQLGNVTIGDYKGTLSAPEEITSEQKVLTIDKAKFFNFKVDDIQKMQSNVDLIDKAMARASVGIADVIDQDIAELSKEAGTKLGKTDTPLVIDTPEKAYDLLVDVKVALNKANAPKENRFVVVCPEFLGMLEKDARFTRHEGVLTEGVVGVVAGMEVRESNNVPYDEGKKEFTLLAGSESAITFAGQITEIEPYRLENSFADAVKGLYCYGTKVLQPMALVNATVKVGAEAMAMASTRAKATK